MNRDNQEKELFDAALEQPADKRDAFLRGACGGNEELYYRIEELLKAFNASSRILTETSPTTTQGIRHIPPTEDDIGSHEPYQKEGSIKHDAGPAPGGSGRFSLKAIKPGQEAAARYLLEFGTYVLGRGT